MNHWSSEKASLTTNDASTANIQFGPKWDDGESFINLSTTKLYVKNLWKIISEIISSVVVNFVLLIYNTENLRNCLYSCVWKHIHSHSLLAIGWFFLFFIENTNKKLAFFDWLKTDILFIGILKCFRWSFTGLETFKTLFLYFITILNVLSTFLNLSPIGLWRSSWKSLNFQWDKF